MSSTTQLGNRAEAAAAEYLQARGYQIHAMNYRRPYCEIDIVASHGGVIYFVEVKYRSSDRYGGGMDYITPSKLHHMERAAQAWVSERGWSGEYSLSAIAVGGPEFEIMEFVESIY